jgi:hypothetical protein
MAGFSPVAQSSQVNSAPSLEFQGASIAATIGDPVNTALSASGGTGGDIWQASSVPPGLTLLADGQFTGVPLESGKFAMTVTVRDSFGQSASGTVEIDVVGSTAPLTTSQNWAGYVVNGGPFDQVSGTFTVPVPQSGSSSSCATTQCATSTWVGIDGNSNNYLIQAGVVVFSSGSGTGYQSWWEILPNPSENISLGVQPGQLVTVTISNLQNGDWQIVLVNDSTGQSYSTTQPYSGPADSAEWILEAPEVLNTSNQLVELPLLPLASPVSFSSLALTTAEGAASGSVQPLELEDASTGSCAVPTASIDPGFEVATGTLSQSGCS